MQLLSGHYHILVKYKPPTETTVNYIILLVFDLYVWGLVMMFSLFYYGNYVKTKRRSIREG